VRGNTKSEGDYIIEAAPWWADLNPTMVDHSTDAWDHDIAGWSRTCPRQLQAWPIGHHGHRYARIHGAHGPDQSLIRAEERSCVQPDGGTYRGVETTVPPRRRVFARLTRYIFQQTASKSSEDNWTPRATTLTRHGYRPDPQERWRSPLEWTSCLFGSGSSPTRLRSFIGVRRRWTRSWPLVHSPYPPLHS